MIEGACEIEWHGVRLVLLPDRALWLPSERAVLVADVHLGKPASFRAGGVPVPEAVTGRDLERLSASVRATGAERLVVLGDLIHDQTALLSRTLDAVTAWRSSLGGVPVELVPGNHDRKARSCGPLGVIEWGDSLMLGGLCCTHEPPDDAGTTPTLCGHLHPVVSIGAAYGATRVRSACFWFEGFTGVLPAFGSFTGGHAMPAGAGRAVFAAGDRAVVPVTKTATVWADFAGGRGAQRAYDRA